MKGFFPVLLFLFLGSCTELTLDNEEPLDVSALTPSTIDTDLEVVNIQTDQVAFDYMYENYNETLFVDGRLTWYTNQGGLRVDQVPVQLEIKGSGSATYTLKSLGIIFENDLDNGVAELLKPPRLLGSHSLEKFKKIRLRNSGNDFNDTMIKDLAYTELAIENDLDIDLMYGKPVQVFINERYFGLLNVRNESDAEGVSRLLQATTEQITLLEVDSDNGNLEHKSGSQQLTNVLITALKTHDTNLLWELLDIHNFIDYLIFEDYIGNEDWPHNNTTVYSLDGGPFRFFMFDLDRTAYHTKNPRIPELEYLDDDVSLIFQALMDRPEFLEMLEKRQKHLYKQFSKDQFYEIVDRFSERIEDDMKYQIARYGIPSSELHWKLNLEKLKRNFEAQDKHIRKKYGL